MNAPIDGVARTTIPVDGAELPLTIARAGSRGAAIVIAPSAFGVPADLERQMRELAADASLVVTFDPFVRTDPGPAPYADFARVMARVRAHDPERLQRDLRATLAWARTQTDAAVVVLGICFGGPHALHLAADGAVEGVVTWHGTRMEEHLARANEMRCPMRHHFGSVDPFVRPEAVDAIRAAFAAHADVRIEVHEGATHGFTHRGAPEAHDPGAERAAMASLRDLVLAL